MVALQRRDDHRAISAALDATSMVVVVRPQIQVISIAHVKTGSKAISEPKTGADWEWHFGTPDNNRWFSLRVQAKKARAESRWGFHDIERKRTRRNQRQIDVLIKDAGTRYWPIYVLYDGRFFTQSTPLASCHQCPRNPGGFGAVTFADAKSMRELVRRKNMGCSVVRQISRPLPCLIDCPFNQHLGSDLPEKVRYSMIGLWRHVSIIRAELGAPHEARDDFPGIFERLPDHVLRLREMLPEDGAGPIYQFNGEWRLSRPEPRSDRAVETQGDDPEDRLAGLVVVQGA